MIEVTSTHQAAPAHPVVRPAPRQTPSARNDAQTQQPAPEEQQRQDKGSFDGSSTPLLTTAKASRKATASQQTDQPARASRPKKKARRSPKQHSAPAVPLPLDATTPLELGTALLAHGVLQGRADAFGHQTGQWVAGAQARNGNISTCRLFPHTIAAGSAISSSMLPEEVPATDTVFVGVVCLPG